MLWGAPECCHHLRRPLKFLSYCFCTNKLFHPGGKNKPEKGNVENLHSLSDRVWCMPKSPICTEELGTPAPAGLAPSELCMELQG